MRSRPSQSRGIGLLALVANSICLALLWKHRNEDINMSSVWECSRNDIISNIAVIVAAGGVWLFQSGWPDLVVGLALSLMMINSARRILISVGRAQLVEVKKNAANSR